MSHPPKQDRESVSDLNERRYHSLVAATSAFLWRNSTDGELVDISEDWLTLVGLTQEDARGWGWLVAVHPDDRDAYRQAWLRAVAEGSMFEHEYRLCCHDGEIRWFVDRGVAVTDHAGGIVEWIGAGQDITAAKHAEHELRRQREQYRTLVESTSAILWEGDPETFRFGFVSSEAETLLGYPVARWLDEPDFWISHIHPGDRTWAPAYCARATAEQRQHSFDYRMIAADGRIVWLRDVVTVLIEDNRPVKLVGVMIDITATKESEAALTYVSGLQRNLVTISQRFIASGPEQFDALIDDALARVGAYCEVDRGYLFRFGDDREHLVNTHEWAAPGASREIDRLHHVPRDTIPNIVARIERSEVVQVPRLADLGPGWQPDRAHLESQSIRSLIVVPIVAGHEVHGFIGLDSVRAERAWSEEEAHLLQGLADVIGAAIQRDRDERARRESEERFQAVAENLPGNIYQRVMDPDGRMRITYASPSLGPLFGMDQQRALDDRNYILEHIHPDDWDRYEAAVEHSARTLERQDVEFRICPPEGPVRWLRSIARPRAGDDGSIVWNGLAIDETDRKQAEERLHETRALLEMAGRAARLGGWSVDLASGRLVWSDVVCAIHGVPAGTSPTVEEALTWYAAEDRKRIRDAYAACARDGLPFDEEAAILTASGARVWIRTIGEAVRNDTGAITQVRGAFQDITQQKRAREEIDRLAERLGNTLESITDGFFTLDRDWRVTYVNGQAERMLKIRRDVILGQVIWHSFPDAVGTAIEREYRRAMDEGSAVSLEEYYPVLETWFEIHAYPSEEGLAVYFRDVTERRRAREEIEFLALYDPLTRLPNRQLLHDRLQQVLPARDRDTANSAILFLDVDNFKGLNDTLGHDIGDRLLRQVAARLTRNLREDDTVARFGGDEFAIIVRGLDGDTTRAAAQAEGIAHKLLAELTRPYHLGEYERHCSVSIGVTLIGGTDETVDDLLKRADLAMYRAKDDGRNTVRLFEPAMRAAIQSRVTLEAELRAALEHGEIVPYYQPQKDAAGRLVGAEALARWPRREGEPISPAVFISVAEESGLILPLGDAILEAACRQVTTWAGRPATAHLSVAVNVSARQFHHPRFADHVEAILERTGAPAERVFLELTESLLLVDVDDTIDKMNRLKRLGLRFSLDDFGTGYSSLAYLKRLPLDQLKIDQGFVREALTDANDAAIVRTIIVLAQTMGLNVIAEGVETEAVRVMLEKYGCTAYQGYLFGHPVTAGEFDALI